MIHLCDGQTGGKRDEQTELQWHMGHFAIFFRFWVPKQLQPHFYSTAGTECAKMFAVNGQTNCATANRQKCSFLIFFNEPSTSNLITVTHPDLYFLCL